MAVKAIHDPSGGDAWRVMGGFEDGSVLLWDGRMPSGEVSALKLFSEPGEYYTWYHLTADSAGQVRVPNHSGS